LQSLPVLFFKLRLRRPRQLDGRYAQTGTVFWEEKSAPELDDEYSVNIDTPSAAGATAGRLDGVHVEFDASETNDILADDLKIPWWQQFKECRRQQ
jgi:hypothetical protein